LKEYSIVYKPGCQELATQFEKCMNDKGCNNVNLGFNSCFRRNCYNFYRAFETDCAGDPSLIPTRCAGSSLIVLFGLLVIVLFMI